MKKRRILKHSARPFRVICGFVGKITYNRGVNTIVHFSVTRLSALVLAAALCAVAATGQEPAGAVLQRGIFRIEYPAEQHALAEYTLAILEDAIAEYDPVLPAGDGLIRVVVADTPIEFDRYAVHFTGLSVSGLAQPGSNLIVVKAPRMRMPGSDYPGTLRHELVHLLLYRNITYDHLPQWLNEGIAMSLANEFYWQGLFKVAQMFVQNRIIPYHLLDDSFYAPSDQMQFNDAYAQALSMTRHLRDRLGEDVFWTLVHELRDAPFHVALRNVAGLSVIEFWAGYERALWKYAVIAAMASGFFFQPAAILVIIAYLRRRHIARGIYERWEAEEAAEAETGGPVPHWEEFVEDPDAWKDGYDDDDESW